MAARHVGLEAIEISRRGHTPTLDEPESRKAIDAFIQQL
jgi:methionine salvage enolase-phosphatase E1